jgi:ABC-2 type transport system ATP-binding protein
MSNIDIKNVSKAFGETQALRDVSIKLDQGKIYGLLGRNGAGKTTLLNVITNKLFPDQGSVLLDGDLVSENDMALSQIYMMTEKNYYPPNMKVKQAFKWSKEFYPNFNIEYANMLADKFALDTKKKTKNLSTGYNSIFKIIIGLAAEVKYLLFDEPVLGLDANHRDMFYKILIENYTQNPKTIVISTHLIEEAAHVIEDIIIIDKGKVIMDESCEELLSKGYAVSGLGEDVDNFIIEKSIIGTESLGGLKTAYVWGKLDKSELNDKMQSSKLDLQRLFIHLTNERSEIK